MVLKDRQYKESEIGLVPNDWDVVQLSTVGKFSKGQGIRKDEALDGEIPCVRYGELYTKHSDYIKQYYSFITKETSQTSKKLKTGDILFAGSGETKEEIGKCAAFVDDIEVYAGGDIVILSPTKAEPLYLGYLLNAPIVQRQKASKAQGDAIVHISANQLGSLQIPLPPTKSEQTAIATALSDADSLIESLENLITKKQNIKQGAMQELLTGKKRLAGFEGNWGIKLLGDMAEINTGKKNNDDKTEQGLYPFYVRSQIVERINSYSFDGEAILIPGEGNIGSIYHYINGKFDYHQRVYKISNFDVNICVKYVYYCMLQNFNAHAMKNTVKATVDSLRLPTFQKFEVYIPPHLEEQKAIARILTDFETEIEILQEKLQKYRMTKHGMMQALLTGKIRLI